MSHQTMIDSVTDKGTALSSAQVKGKLKELANSYKALCHTAQAQVKTAEQQVDQHQTFADSYQQCKDWITMTKDKLAVCNEVSGDKQTLQNRLDRVKVTTFHHLFILLQSLKFLKPGFLKEKPVFDREVVKMAHWRCQKGIPIVVCPPAILLRITPPIVFKIRGCFADQLYIYHISEQCTLLF